MKVPQQNAHSLGKAMLSDNPPQSTLADMKIHPMKKNSWGFHLLIDMSKCNDKIDSLDAVETFFEELIEELGMTPLSEIIVKKVTGEQGRGVSAVQMITTSSITFHSDDEERSVYLDVFSCKEFNPKQVLEFATDYFQPKEHAAQMIYRDAGIPK